MPTDPVTDELAVLAWLNVLTAQQLMYLVDECVTLLANKHHVVPLGFTAEEVPE